MIETFILASNSEGKKKEILRMLAPELPGIRLLTAGEAGFAPIEPEEAGESFRENALIKARAFVELTGMPAIADDSGLCVDALDGAPGIHSARFGGDHDPDSGIRLMLTELDGLPRDKRTAHFCCHVCCLWPDGRLIESEGRCEGYIGTQRGGTGGFGFDPVFYLPDGTCFAALSAEQKDAHSHRGNALRGLISRLR